MIEMKQRSSGFVPPSLFKRKAEMNSHLNDSTENILVPGYAQIAWLDSPKNLLSGQQDVFIWGETETMANWSNDVKVMFFSGGTIGVNGLATSGLLPWKVF